MCFQFNFVSIIEPKTLCRSVRSDAGVVVVCVCEISGANVPSLLSRRVGEDLDDDVGDVFFALSCSPSALQKNKIGTKFEGSKIGQYLGYILFF